MIKFRKLKNNRKTYPELSYNLYYTKPVVVFQVVQLMKVPRKIGVFETVSEDEQITETELDNLISVINEVNDRLRKCGRDYIFSLNL